MYRQWRRQVDLGLHDLGLSDASRMPLITLYAQAAPMRQKDLATALHLESSSLVRVLAQLRADGLVDWHSAEGDRRTKCIALTARGHQVAARILELSMAIEARLLADLPPAELATLRNALETISARLDQLPA